MEMLSVYYCSTLAVFSLVWPVIEGRQYDVAAYYYPAWHVDKTGEKLHGANWTEWELVKNAKPRWNGHVMPKVPLWGYEMDDDPAVFAKKIDAASSNGVDVLIFDWYWYEDAPEPYLTRSLEKGFLEAENKEKVKFALMWANQPLLDIMPAKRAWRGDQVQVYSGQTTMESFQKAIDYIIDNYFTQPEYYRVHGCPYLSFYHVQELVQSFHEKTKDALDYIVNRTKEKGVASCVHLNGIDTIMRSEKNASSLVKSLNLTSLTSYTWFHYGPTFNAFPVTDYAHALQVNKDYWDKVNSSYPVFYIPNVSASWDSSPRTCITDVFDNSGYPYGPTFSSTPSELRQALVAVKAFLDRTCAPDWCMVTVNAWNEWSESAYLEPDTVDGYGRLNAIRDILGPSAET